MNRFSIPSKFELSNEIVLNNPNFQLVKVRIMSSGENYNGSSFTINSLNNAKNSVAYSPVLANIVKNDNDEWDYGGHDINTEIKMDYNGNVVIEEEYVERPVGVFLNNSTEIKYDEELDVNYIQAYAVLWDTYSKAIDILKRDGVKDVSVEIEVTQGELRDDGYYEIQEYNILGTTLLGQNVLPAIEGSKVEMCFSLNDDYQDKLKQVDILLQNFACKGGEDMENKEFEQGIENTEIEEQQEFAEEEEKEEVCEDCGKPKDECECDKEEDNEEEFQQEPQDDEEPKLYTQKDLDEAVANAKAEFSQAMEELETLRQFKLEYDKAIEVQKLNDEMDNLIAQFNCDEEFVSDLREKVIANEISMEKFELELYRNSKPVEKKEFSKKENSTKLPVIDNEEKISDIDEFFASFGVKRKK